MAEEPVRVLVIDDSEFMRRVIGSHLAESEFELAAAVASGTEGVESFRDLRPDVVLLDIVMPERSGKEILAELLRTDSDARVVMVSSLGTDAAVTECLRAGARLFIQKPFEKGDLLAALRHALEP